MGDFPDNDDNMQSGHIKLKEGIDINALLEGKGDTFEINYDNIEDNEEDDTAMEPDKNCEKEIIELTGACLGLDTDDEDEKEIDTSSPFEKLALKMVNVTDDGKIKKKIKKQGVGLNPPANSRVSIRYSSYLEYNDAPTDTAYMSKPFHFRLGTAGVFGLNIAVQSMRVNEIAWFLIHPIYAFGELGHTPRVPPNATFLFYVELLNFIDSGPVHELDEMSLEDKKKFPKAYASARALLESAKFQFSRNIKLSIREYNKAKHLLEECNLSNMEEQEQQQQQLFRIYSNLAVCYTKDNAPKRACSMCNNVYAMAKNTSLKVPAKIFFHNGRALFMLGDYKRAKELLLKARNLDPNNNEINNELKLVFGKINEEAERERRFAKAFIPNAFATASPSPSTSKCENNDDDNEFTKEVRTQCEKLKLNTNSSDFKLPWGLTHKERDAAKAEAARAGLNFREVVNGDNEDNRHEVIYVISKV